MRDPAVARGERRILAEVERLGHFSRENYSGPTLSQEQIAESLTQTRLALVTHGWRGGLYGILPVAAAPRIVSIRALEPIPIHLESPGSGDDALARASMLRDLRDRLQSGLDQLNAEIESRMEVHRFPNPFANSATVP